MGKRRLTAIFLFLFSVAAGLHAQERPSVSDDGPLLRTDSLRTGTSVPEPSYAKDDYMILPPMPAPGKFETKEERAARINAFVANSVRQATGISLSRFSVPQVSNEWKPVVSGLVLVSSLFLSNPFGIPFGYMPMDNPSNPYALAKIPGMAPVETYYGPEAFPQAVRTEYDASTGKYKQVMVDWSEFQSNLSFSFGNYYGSKAVPKIPVTETERRMMGQ